MATHDYVLDNASGAAFRTDLNNALAAIVSNNSNSSSPATTYAYQWWADTSAGVLKIRNSANNAWIELLQLDGTLTLEDGSASTPALAFRDDLDTGIFSSASNTFNIATGGVERMELGSTTIFNEDGADVDFRIEGDTDAALFFVNAGLDQIGIGTDSPQNRMHMHKGDSDKCVLQFTNSTTGLASGDGFQIGLSSSEQGLINMKESASILFKTADSDVMTIDSSGKVGIGTTNPAEQLVVMGSGDPTIRIQETASGSGKRLDLGVTDSGAVGFIGANQSASKLAFQTVGSERMRIDDNGSVLVATTSTTVNTSNFGIVLGSDGSGGFFKNAGGSSDIFQAGGNEGKAVVFGNGNITNTNGSYGQTSDETLKQDIVDAASQWNDIKNLRVRKFRFKDNPTGVLQIGVVAQEIETVSAGLVQENEEGIKSVKYSVLYMKAVKCLQEAIAKIEVLETKVAALEAA